MTKYKLRMYIYAILIVLVIFTIIWDIFPANIPQAYDDNKANIPPIEYIGKHGQILTDAYNNVSIVEHPENTDYVLVDFLYTFPEIDSYTKVGSYIDRVVMTSSLDVKDVSFANTMESFNRKVKNFSSYGIYHTSLNELKYGIPEYWGLFDGYMHNRYYNIVKDEDLTYMQCGNGNEFFKKDILENGLNIMLKTSTFKYANQRIIAEDEMEYPINTYKQRHIVGAVFDLYVKNNANNKTALELPGMERLNPDEPVINILTHSPNGVKSKTIDTITFLKGMLYAALICTLLVISYPMLSCDYDD